MNQLRSILLLVLVLQLALICRCHNKQGQRRSASVEGENGSRNHVAAFENKSIGFERIEELLQAQVANESPEDNLQVALKLLEEQRAKSFDQRDWPLFWALKQFVALDGIKFKEGAETEALCDNQSYEILRKLNSATGGSVRRTKSRRGPLRRIELILLKIAQNHAEQCKNVYPRRFCKLLETFSSKTIQQIDTIMKQLLDARIKGTRLNPTGLKVKTPASLVRRALVDFMEHKDSFKTRRDAKIVGDFLKTFTKAGANNNAVMRGGTNVNSINGAKMGLKKVKAIFMSNLIEPCREYMDIFGPDIFVPAGYDALMLDRTSRFRPGVQGDTHEDFIDGWVRYGFCFMLERDKEALMNNVERLMLKE